MGENKRIRKQIEGYERQVRLHRDKIREERAKRSPDRQLNAKWEKEIYGFQTIIARLERKLPGKRRR